MELGLNLCGLDLNSSVFCGLNLGLELYNCGNPTYFFRDSTAALDGDHWGSAQT